MKILFSIIVLTLIAGCGLSEEEIQFKREIEERLMVEFKNKDDARSLLIDLSRKSFEREMEMQKERSELEAIIERRRILNQFKGSIFR